MNRLESALRAFASRLSRFGHGLALVGVVDDVEIQRAREAVRMIVARGYARGRDLHGAFDAWLGNRVQP